MKLLLGGLILGSAAIAIYFRHIPHDVIYAMIDPRYQVRPILVPAGRGWDVYVCPSCGQRWATRSAAETCSEQECR